MAHKSTLQLKTVSSLEKVFPYTEPTTEIFSASALKNESFNFQLCVKSAEHLMDATLQIESDISEYISLFCVDYVPVTSEIRRGLSDDYLINRDEIGLYPDILRPLGVFDCVFKKNIWVAYWINVRAKEGLPTGIHSIIVKIYNDKSEFLDKAEFTLEVIDGELAENDRKILNWIHYDSICYSHKVKYLSVRFYKVLNNYLVNAVENGLNTLYTPALSPSVDTDKNTYRMDMQLVDINKTGCGYSFNFEKLLYFINNAKQKGIKHFAFSHIATQWGADKALRIRIGSGKDKRYIFGWNTPSDDGEYRNFLKAYFCALRTFLNINSLTENVMFHISDEPTLEKAGHYHKLSSLLHETIPGSKVIDAVSERHFTHGDDVDIPAIASEKFMQLKSDREKWIYYCCVQKTDYISNRFINMPSQRNRILGIQMYLNDIKGFLHWAHNFYASYLSKAQINPYIINDAMGMFEAGDCFVVYPHNDGVINSLRHLVFSDGLQDLRALITLEKYIGRNSVKAMITAEGVSGLSVYPRSAMWHLSFREKINSLILQESQKMLQKKIYSIK